MSVCVRMQNWNLLLIYFLLAPVSMFQNIVTEDRKGKRKRKKGKNSKQILALKKQNNTHWLVSTVGSVQLMLTPS